MKAPIGINPNPRFIPTPGTPTAAPAHFPYDHPTLAEVEARAAKCRKCNGRSPEWKVGVCKACGNTGLANPFAPR